MSTLYKVTQQLRRDWRYAGKKTLREKMRETLLLRTKLSPVSGRRSFLFDAFSDAFIGKPWFRIYLAMLGVGSSNNTDWLNRLNELQEDACTSAAGLET